jgi:hypothetical protein
MFKKLFFLLAIIATAVNGFAVSSLNGGKKVVDGEVSEE